MGLLHRLPLALKAARQLGARQAGWYALYQAGLKSGLWRALTPPGKYHPLEIELRPVFHLPDGLILAKVMGEETGTLFAEADAIVAGRFRPYGGELAELRLAPPGPLCHWTAPKGRGLPGEDIKDTWEPARFGWAFTLGRAYRLAGDERYPAAFWQHFETFLAANPPNLGPNWISAQEVALRLVALLFADQVFADSQHSSPARRALLAGALAAHARRIPPTLSYAQAQHNNHLLSEGLGLLLAGHALHQHPQAAGWARLGQRVLDGGLRAQISPEGVYAQHSLNYHRLMLHTALLADTLRAAVSQPASPQSNDRPLSPPARERLAAATRWLRAQVDPRTGQAPNYGHNDGANILPLARSILASGPLDNGGFADQRPTLQAAARAFLGHAALPPGPWDELSLWLGLGLDEPPSALPAPASPVVHRLGDDQSWGLLRAGRYTSRPAHADQLHVDLWWQGRPVTLDAGTYRYNAPRPWDNGLAATAVHNTISIDGQDQMQRAGRFLWLDWAQARLLESSRERLSAEHTGYLRLGVRHRRVLTRLSAQRWQVLDELLPGTAEPPGEHLFCLHWLLPDAPYRLEAGTLQVELPPGRMTLHLALLEPAGLPVAISLARAGQNLAGPGEASPLSGWYSPTYGLKLPALSLTLTIQARPPVQLVSQFTLEPRPGA